MEPQSISIGKPKTTPREFFLYFGSMVLLYANAVIFLALLFSYIDYTFPDILNYCGSECLLNQIRFPLSAIVILLPFFVFLSSRVTKDLREDPAKKELGIRKWLVYFTLFFTLGAIIVDLIILINKFLSGDTSTQFFLKVFSVLLVAGGVFGYYFLEIKGQVSQKIYRIAISFFSIAVMASVVWGFVIVGSPSEARAKRFDEVRVSDLSNIQNQIIYVYWSSKGKLPENVNELGDSISGFVLPKDPEGKLEEKKEYRYQKTGALSFSLCATFNRANTTGNATSKTQYQAPQAFGQENWNHGAGEHCFTRVVDPELYPIRPKAISG
ncbi:MAG: DUF5671 domain-containing protein [Patescibacteria group bacterium]